MQTMANHQRNRITKKAISESRNAETIFYKQVNLNMPFLSPDSYLSHIKRF